MGTWTILAGGLVNPEEPVSLVFFGLDRVVRSVNVAADLAALGLGSETERPDDLLRGSIRLEQSTAGGRASAGPTAVRAVRKEDMTACRTLPHPGSAAHKAILPFEDPTGREEGACGRRNRPDFPTTLSTTRAAQPQKPEICPRLTCAFANLESDLQQEDQSKEHEPIWWFQRATFADQAVVWKRGTT